MARLKTTSFLLAGAIITLVALVFLLDWVTELGVAGGVPYIAPVLVSLWTPGRRYVILVAAITTALSILGLAVSPEGGELWKVLVNRSYAVSAIWLVALVGLQRKHAEEVISASEARYRTLTELALSAIVTADSAGTIIGWNRAAETMFGYTQTEALGQPLTALMPERYRRAHTNGLERYLSTREPHAIRKTLEVEGLRKGGDEFPMGLSISTWGTQERTFFTGIVRDLTERKRLEEIESLRMNELETLQAVSTLLTSGATLNAKLAGTLRELARVSDATEVVLRTPNDEQLALQLVAWVSEDSSLSPPIALLPYSEGLSGFAFREGEAVISNDYASDPRIPSRDSDRGTRSGVFLPIKAEGRTIGILSMLSSERGHFTDQHLQLLTSVGAELGVLLENARLRAAKERLGADG